MPLNLENLLYIFGAGILLIAGVFILRGVLKVAWKFVRAALILAAIILIAGYVLGFFQISLR